MKKQSCDCPESHMYDDGYCPMCGWSGKENAEPVTLPEPFEHLKVVKTPIGIKYERK